jgi:hypothetical protein
MAEAFLRYINSELTPSQRDRRIGIVLAEIQRTNRALWAVLEERYFYHRSYAAIAEQLLLSDVTVRKICLSGLLLVQQRFLELFGESY